MTQQNQEPKEPISAPGGPFRSCRFSCLFVLTLLILLFNMALVSAAVLLQLPGHFSVAPCVSAAALYILSFMSLVFLCSPSCFPQSYKCKCKLLQFLTALLVLVAFVSALFVLVASVITDLSVQWLVWASLYLVSLLISTFLLYKRFLAVSAPHPPPRVESVDFRWGTRIEVPRSQASLDFEQSRWHWPWRRINSSTSLRAPVVHESARQDRQTSKAARFGQQCRNAVNGVKGKLNVSGRAAGAPHQCPVCLDNPSNRILSCDHDICASCLEKMLHKHRLCPICRRIIGQVREINTVIGTVVTRL